MPIVSEWYDGDQPLVECTAIDHWTLDDLRHMVDTLSDHLKQRRQSFHIVFNLTKITSRPQNLLSVARYAEKRLKANNGAVILVTSSRYFRALAVAARHLAPRLTKNIYFVDCISGVDEILEECNENLDAIHVA